MGPEILIVGDRSHRGELIPRVQDLGYTVTPVRERELLTRVAQSPNPAAVIVCLGGPDAGGLVQALRRSREGASTPVLLYGRLQGEFRDLADVLELGADRFLESPVDVDELAAALAELAGPPDVGQRPRPRPSQAGAPAREGRGDPILSQLHRTLEILAARLESREEPADGDGDEIDLEAMGLDAVPDVDPGHAGEEELELLREPTHPLGVRGAPREAEPAAAPSPRRHERTEPLARAPKKPLALAAAREGSGRAPEPAAAREGSGRTPEPARPRDVDSPTLRLPKTGRWGGRGDLTGERGREEISLERLRGAAEPDAPVRRRDPTTERTAPVATAARDDVRKDRSGRGREVAGRGDALVRGTWPEGHGEKDTTGERGSREETGRVGGRVGPTDETTRLPAFGAGRGASAAGRPRGEAERGAGPQRESVRGAEDVRGAAGRQRGETGEASRMGRLRAEDEGSRAPEEREVSRGGRLRGEDGRGVEEARRLRGEDGRGVEREASRGSLRSDAGGAREDEAREAGRGRFRSEEAEAARGASRGARFGVAEARGEEARGGSRSTRFRVDVRADDESSREGTGRLSRFRIAEDVGEDEANALRIASQSRGDADARVTRRDEAAPRAGDEAATSAWRGEDMPTSARVLVRGAEGSRESTTRLSARGVDGGLAAARAEEPARVEPVVARGRAEEPARVEPVVARGRAEEPARVAEPARVESVVARDRADEPLAPLGEARARGEGDGASVLAELRRERFTGCVEARATDGPRRRLWWSEGQVIGGASASAGESVLGRLSARGLIDAGHLELADRWSSGDPRRDVERLAQAGWIKPQEAQEALREPVRRIVERVAEGERVAWTLHPGDRPAVAVELGVPLAALIAGGVRRGWSREQLRATVPDALRPRLSFVGPEALAGELRWPEATAIAGRFDGQTSVGALVAAAVAEEEEIRGLVHVLGLLGHLAPPVEDVAASLVALDRRRVRERLRMARETDYFALLGLPREATRAEVLRAHADLTATFREALEPGSRVELAEELAELLAALDEARDVLTDEALHSAYLAQLGEP